MNNCGKKHSFASSTLQVEELLYLQVHILLSRPQNFALVHFGQKSDASTFLCQGGELHTWFSFVLTKIEKQNVYIFCEELSDIWNQMLYNASGA